MSHEPPALTTSQRETIAEVRRYPREVVRRATEWKDVKLIATTEDGLKHFLATGKIHPYFPTSELMRAIALIDTGDGRAEKWKARYDKGTW